MHYGDALHPRGGTSALVGRVEPDVNSLSESTISLNGRYKELAMTATTHMTLRRDENSVRNFTASSSLAENLQRVLVDLIELHLQGKQAHWDVIRKNCPALHLQLDELVDFAREGSDTIAERMRALDAIPDGRSDTVTATTSLPQFPADERNTAEVVDLITTRTYAAVDTIRKVHDAVDADGPSTADILHEQNDGLEKLAWLIKSENHKV